MHSLPECPGDEIDEIRAGEWKDAINAEVARFVYRFRETDDNVTWYDFFMRSGGTSKKREISQPRVRVHRLVALIHLIPTTLTIPANKIDYKHAVGEKDIRHQQDDVVTWIRNHGELALRKAATPEQQKYTQRMIVAALKLVEKFALYEYQYTIHALYLARDTLKKYLEICVGQVVDHVRCEHIATYLESSETIEDIERNSRLLKEN